MGDGRPVGAARPVEEAASGAGPASAQVSVARGGAWRAPQPRGLGGGRLGCGALPARRAAASDSGARGVRSCSFFPAGGVIDNGSHAPCVRPLSRVTPDRLHKPQRPQKAIWQSNDRSCTEPGTMRLIRGPRDPPEALNRVVLLGVFSCRVFLSRQPIVKLRCSASASKLDKAV